MIRFVVPAGSTRGIAHTLVHEYGHHVDAFNRHGGLEEPNGTRNWWRVRGLARLVESTREIADLHLAVMCDQVLLRQLGEHQDDDICLIGLRIRS